MEQAVHEMEVASPLMSLVTPVVHQTQAVAPRTILSQLPYLARLSYPSAAQVQLTDSGGVLPWLECLDTEAR